MTTVSTPTTVMGFQMNFVIRAMARAELNRAKSRASARVKRMRAEGRSTGGLTPYGYQRAQHAALELEHDPVSSGVLREVVQRVIDGNSIASVARDLNSRGVLSPRDHSANRDGKIRTDRNGKLKPRQLWTDQTLRRMLTNPVLLGKLVIDGKVIRNSDGRAKLRGEPLVSVDDWTKLQDAIAGNKRPKYRSAPDALLSGIAVCGDCDSPAALPLDGKARKKAGIQILPLLRSNSSGQRVYHESDSRR